MLVVLKRPWFCGTLYSVSPAGVEVPDELRDQLPPGAEVVEEEVAVLDKLPQPQVLADLEESVGMGEVTSPTTLSELGKALQKKK